MTTSTTRQETASMETGVHRGWLTAARILMGLSGAQLLVGAIYFLFFATPDEGGVVSAFDWFVAIWALVAALGLLATSLAPFPARSTRLQAAWWVMGVHLLWALVKLLAYDEMPVSAIVVLVDLVILILLWRAGRARD